MFKITEGKGFSIQFENGWKVSVQFGPYNYGDHYGLDNIDPVTLHAMKKPEEECGAKGSTLAETALIDTKGEFIDYDGGSVQGYRTPAQVLELLNYAAKL